MFFCLSFLYHAFCSVSTERHTIEEAVNVLTRYSRANRPERTCYFFTAGRTARLARPVRTTLSALHCAGAPTFAVGVTPPHTGGGGPTASSVPRWGFCCTERVNGPSDLNLLRERSCFDPHESGVSGPLLKLVWAMMRVFREADTASVFDGRGKSVDPLLTLRLLC